MRFALVALAALIVVPAAWAHAEVTPTSIEEIEFETRAWATDYASVHKGANVGLAPVKEALAAGITGKSTKEWIKKWPTESPILGTQPVWSTFGFGDAMCIAPKLCAKRETVMLGNTSCAAADCPTALNRCARRSSRIARSIVVVKTY